MTNPHKSLLALIVVLTFCAALAFLLVVVSLPREQEFESDGWTSKSLPFYYEMKWPKGAVSLHVNAKDNPYEHRMGAMAYAHAGVKAEFQPDPRLTPGAIFKEATLENIKQPNYSKTVRNVTEKMRLKVMDDYGWPHDKPCEIDHLVPLSIGGGQDKDHPTSNLWPQPLDGVWNAHIKDRLEVHILAEIRAGKMDLKEAQTKIARDWISFYKEVFGPEPKAVMSREEEQ